MADDLRTQADALVSASRADITPVMEIRRRVQGRRRRRIALVATAASACGLLGLGVLTNTTEPERVAAGPAAVGPVSLGHAQFPRSTPPAVADVIVAEIVASTSEESLLRTPAVVNDRVRVDLRVGYDRVGAALKDRYGDRVDVSIGGLAWPAKRQTAPNAWCAVAPSTTGTPGITARLSVVNARPRFGDRLTGSVTIENTTDRSLRVRKVNNGWVEGALLAPDGSVAGGVPTAELLVDAYEPVPPNSSVAIPVEIAPGSCTPWSGTATQPGSYDAVAVVKFADGTILFSTAVPVQIDQPAVSE